MASISPHGTAPGPGYGHGSGPNSAPGSASDGGSGSSPVYISGPAYVSGPLFFSGAVFVSPPGPCCGPCPYFVSPPGPGPRPGFGPRHIVNDLGSRSTVDNTIGTSPHPGVEFAPTSSPGITPVTVPDARQRFLREMADTINAPDRNTWVDAFCAKFSAAWDQGLVPSTPNRKGKKAHYANRRKGQIPSATPNAADGSNHHEINGEGDVSVTI